MKNNKMSPRYVAAIGMLAALSFVAVVTTEWIPKVQGFLSYEPKDVLVVMGGFIYGPLSGALIAVLVSFIEMITISQTGIYGFLMNVVSTCSFAIPAAWFYQKRRTKKDAVIGLSLGVVTMVAAMLLWNYIITPLYMKVPRATVAGMLLTVFLPFNLVKGGINAGITLVLYKPVVTALRKAKLAEPSSAEAEKGKFSVGFLLFSLAVLITFLLWFLILSGVL